MFALVVNLDVRMVGSHVTLAAVLRRARQLRLERMARVAGMAGAFGPVRVEPADAAVGPRRRVQQRLIVGGVASHVAAGVALELDDGAVALPAAVDGVGDVARHAGGFFGEHVVEAGENLACARVVAAGKLLVFGVVALRAVLRRHNRRNPRAAVLPRRWRAGLAAVAVEAADAVRRVARTLPLHHERGRLRAVALHASLALIGGGR